MEVALRCFSHTAPFASTWPFVWSSPRFTCRDLKFREMIPETKEWAHGEELSGCKCHRAGSRFKSHFSSKAFSRSHLLRVPRGGGWSGGEWIHPGQASFLLRFA